MRSYTIIIIMSTSMVSAVPSVTPGFADQVLLRLYGISRIRPSIKIIKQLTLDQLSVVDKPMVLMGGVYENKNILQLWKDLKQYKYLHDASFLPYVLYRILLVLVQTKKVPYSSLQKDFDGINVEEFLSAIDVVVNQAYHINQHYHDSGLSFNDWIKQYWWIPCILTASIFIKIVKCCYLYSEGDFFIPLHSSSKFKGF